MSICDWCKKEIDESKGVIIDSTKSGVKKYHPSCYQEVAKRMR